MIPPRVAAFASRIGLTGLAIAILLALLAVQTVRLEGFKLWPLGMKGWIETADGWRDKAEGCELRHRATRASLEKLIAHNAKLVADGKAREKRQQEAVEAQEARSAALDSQIDRIRAQRPVAAPVGQECKSPAAVLEAEGL